MRQILSTNDNTVNVKVDEWVRELCIKNGYKIKRHYTAAGNITFTINKKPFAGLFFDRMDDFSQHTMINKSKIRKMATYGPLVNKKGLEHVTPSAQNKVELYDLTMSNFLHAGKLPQYDVGLANVAVVTSDDDIFTNPATIDSFVQDAVSTRLGSDILYESKKLGVAPVWLMLQVFGKVVERVED